LKEFRILSFGAGAIGTYIGGSLALQGHQVVFLERPEVATQIRKTGLFLDLKGTIHKVEFPIMAESIETALALGPFDFGLFALKSYDTQAALREWAPFSDQFPPILCMQNGVENESALAQLLGSERVIPGTLTSAVGRQAAGNIVLERLRGAGVAGGHSLSETLVEAFNQAGLNARLFPQAAAMKWSKMLTNLLANATTAILAMTPEEIFHDDRLVRLEMHQLREALQVMDALNYAVVNLPGTPVRLLAFGVRFLPLPLLKPLLGRAVGKGRGAKMPSFYLDLHSGRGKSEVDYLNGAVVRFGKQMGIQAPVNQLLNETLLGLTNRTLSQEDFSHNPGLLLQKLTRF
jgi:2-dehydropantoate 2-reductase